MLFAATWTDLLEIIIVSKISQSKSSLVAQTVKHLPTMRETQVQSLGGEDPLEKELATHSSIHSCLENPMGGAW